MTITPDDEDTRTDASQGETAVSETEPSGTEGSEEASAAAGPFKMSLTADIENAGPCKKHVRIRIPRDDISHYYDAEVGDLISTAVVPGFRQGHVPRKLVERRFRKELADQVKQKVLVESLEQVAEAHDLDPINEPNIDVESIEIPEEGDFEYEFDVEVRPEFDLPDYQGLRIKRPVRDITDAAVESYLERFLGQYGHLDPRDGPAEPDDFVTMSVEFEHQGRPVNEFRALTVQLRPVLRFQDAELTGFDQLMAGVRAGETREADLTISQEAESLEMRGERVQVRFHVREVKRQHLPERNKSFLERVGVESEEELRDEIRSILKRQALYQERQSVREQVLERITESADWDLPEGAVRRQVENALRREILEMQQAGFTPQEIRARENELRQRAVSTTRQALKEHFVLDRIATKEEIQVEPSDIETEIALMAMQSGESPRRVRARLVKSGMIENLEAQIRERKAVDVILEQAEFEDEVLEPVEEERVEAVSLAICGPSEEAAGAEEGAASGDEGDAEDESHG